MRATIIDGTKAVVLQDDRLEDPLGILHIDDLPDRSPENPVRLTDDAPAIVQKLWRAALYDAESNIRHWKGRRYFAAGGRGAGWDGMLFTRDMGFASILGLGRLYGEVMWDALRATRDIRLNMGMKTSREEYHPALPFEDTGLSQEEFKRHYRTNSFIRRTDDVLWLWWAQDLVKATDLDTAETWSWIYETGIQCFDQLYAPFVDEEDGLYRGQSSFVDIGINGYPERFGPDGSLHAKCQSVSIKAASTNCLYYKGLQVMAAAARRLGRSEDATAWNTRAEALGDAIRKKLIRPDGTIIYFIDQEGVMEDRQHTLATAFAVILGVVEAEQALRAILPYPVRWWGVPLIHPFYEHQATYHNNSAWPFSDAFLLHAREIATGQDESLRGIAMMLRSCRGDTFHEYTDARTGQPCGKPAQLWTIGGFVGMCYRAGWVDGSS